MADKKDDLPWGADGFRLKKTSGFVEPLVGKIKASTVYCSL